MVNEAKRIFVTNVGCLSMHVFLQKWKKPTPTFEKTTYLKNPILEILVNGHKLPEVLHEWKKLSARPLSGIDIDKPYYWFLEAHRDFRKKVLHLFIDLREKKRHFPG